MINPKSNLSWRDYILLSIQRALNLWNICPSVRAVSAGWDEHSVDMYFIYDGDISDDDIEVSECIATEVLASFYDETVRTHHVRCDFPNPIPQLGRECIYNRKE